jgi:hypothetical protein
LAKPDRWIFDAQIRFGVREMEHPGAVAVHTAVGVLEVKLAPLDLGDVRDKLRFHRATVHDKRKQLRQQLLLAHVSKSRCPFHFYFLPRGFSALWFALCAAQRSTYEKNVARHRRRALGLLLLRMVMRRASTEELSVPCRSKASSEIVFRSPKSYIVLFFSSRSSRVLSASSVYALSSVVPANL